MVNLRCFLPLLRVFMRIISQSQKENTEKVQRIWKPYLYLQIINTIVSTMFWNGRKTWEQTKEEKWQEQDDRNWEFEHMMWDRHVFVWVKRWSRDATRCVFQIHHEYAEKFEIATRRKRKSHLQQNCTHRYLLLSSPSHSKDLSL